jgi:hypothetical protein
MSNEENIEECINLEVINNETLTSIDNTSKKYKRRQYK